MERLSSRLRCASPEFTSPKKKSRLCEEDNREREVIFYYFGAVFLFEATTVCEPVLSSYDIRDKLFTDKLKKLKDAVCADMDLLNLCCIGAKKQAEEKKFAQWEADGVFCSIGHCVYVYQHTYHAAFSSIKYSQIVKLWKVQNHERSHADKCSVCKLHKYHDHLVPYFQTNDCFESYIEEELKEEQKKDTSTNQLRIQCLKDYQKQLQKKTVDETDLLYEPPLVACNWSEDHWNLRLFHTIKAAFPDIHVQFTARRGLDFSTLQSELSDRVCQPDCFIFHGAPDIMINQMKTVITSDRAEEGVSSGEENSVIEQSFQRHPIKSTKGSYLPEKLGELLAGLYFSLVCKMFREINKQCKIQCHSVNGLLLDKIVGGIHCKLTGNITRLGDKPLLFFETRDASGKQLDPQSLCYNIQLLQTW